MTQPVYIARTAYGQPIAHAIFDDRASALEWCAQRGCEFPGYVLVRVVTPEPVEMVIRRDRRAA